MRYIIYSILRIVFLTGDGYSSLPLLRPIIKRGKTITDEMVAEELMKYYNEFFSDDILYKLNNVLINNSYPELREYFIKNSGIPYIGFRKGYGIKRRFYRLSRCRRCYYQEYRLKRC